MKSKEIEKYEIMKLKYAEDTRAHGKQLRQLQFRRTRLGCPRRSFRSRRRPPVAGVILGGTLALALPSSPKGSGRNVNSS